MTTRINPYRRFVGSFIPNWLLRREEISLGAKLTYARLAQYAGDSGVAEPQQEDLAKELGMKERNLRNLITELISCNLIECERQGLGKPNKYHFLSHEWFTDERQTSATLDRQDSATHEQNKVSDRQNTATLDRQTSATLDRQDSATPFNIESNKDKEINTKIQAPRLIEFEIEGTWKETVEKLREIPKWDRKDEPKLLAWLNKKQAEGKVSPEFTETTAIALVSKWPKYNKQEPYSTFQDWLTPKERSSNGNGKPQGHSQQTPTPSGVSSTRASWNA